jgi:hypothetical protein
MTRAAFQSIRDHHCDNTRFTTIRSLMKRGLGWICVVSVALGAGCGREAFDPVADAGAPAPVIDATLCFGSQMHLCLAALPVVQHRNLACDRQ